MSSAVKLTEKGHAQYKAGNYAAAIDLYDKALTTATLPAHLVALQSNRAACYLKLKDYTKAAEACSGVLQLEPSHEGVLLLRARTLQTTKDFKAALFDCDRLLQLKPSNATYTALHARLQEQIAECAELSAIVEHDVTPPDSSQVGVAFARIPPAKTLQRLSTPVPPQTQPPHPPKQALSPHSIIEARSSRKVGFGVGSQTDSSNPKLPLQSLYSTLSEKLLRRHSAGSVSGPDNPTRSLSSSSTSPKERAPHNPSTGNGSDSHPSTASPHSHPHTFPTQSPTQKVASHPDLPSEPSPNRSTSPVSQKATTHVPVSLPSRTESLPSPPLTSPRERPSHRVVSSHETKPGSKATRHPISPIFEKIMKHIPTPFHPRDQPQPPQLNCDSDPPPETSGPPLSPPIAHKPEARQPSHPAPSSPAVYPRDPASHRVAFAPTLSIPGASETGDQQLPSPMYKDIQKRSKTPHHMKPPALIWGVGDKSMSSSQDLPPGDGGMKEGEEGSEKEGGVSGFGSVIDTEVERIRLVVGSFGVKDVLGDVQDPHRNGSLRATERHTSADSEGREVAAGGGGERVMKGLPTFFPRRPLSEVSDASSHPGSSLAEDAEEVWADDCDKYAPALASKDLEAVTGAPQKSWNGVEEPAYVQQPGGKKVVEGEAPAVLDRSQGGGGAKGFRLPVMPMAPLPYDANPSRVEKGNKKVVIQVDPEMKAKAVASAQPAQKMTDYSSWDNLDVSSDEEEEPKPQYHYKITNMKVQAVAPK